MSIGMSTVHKHLSVVSLIPQWSGWETSVPLEFLSIIEQEAKIGRWDASDQIEITALKLSDSAKSFYNGCLEHHMEDTQTKGEFYGSGIKNQRRKN